MIKSKKIITIIQILLVIFSFIVIGCQKEQNLNTSQISLRTSSFNQTPYTYLQNKYADNILDYEYRKAGLTFDAESYQLEEKLEMIMSIDENKSQSNTDESRADISFYDSLTQALIEEINSHGFIQGLVTHFAMMDEYDENDINMIYGLDCHDFISKLQLLKYFEEGIDYSIFFTIRDSLTGNEYWDMTGYAGYNQLKAMRYTLHSKWTNNVVEYMWNTSSPTIREAMSSAMQDWKTASNNTLLFREITKNKAWNKTLWVLGLKYFIRIDASDSENFGGISTIGKVPWATIAVTSASQRVCRHELGHSLGLLHEHQRPDRDYYITYYPENVKLGFKVNFTKVPAGSYNYYGSTFDFNSIMLYGSSAFQKHAGLYTMRKKDGTTFSSPTNISQSDANVIQMIYN